MFSAASYVESFFPSMIVIVYHAVDRQRTFNVTVGLMWGQCQACVGSMSTFNFDTPTLDSDTQLRMSSPNVNVECRLKMSIPNVGLRLLNLNVEYESELRIPTPIIGFRIDFQSSNKSNKYKLKPDV